jgi:hypothetical protein
VGDSLHSCSQCEQRPVLYDAWLPLHHGVHNVLPPWHSPGVVCSQAYEAKSGFEFCRVSYCKSAVLPLPTEGPALLLLQDFAVLTAGAIMAAAFSCWPHFAVLWLPTVLIT